MINRRGFLRSVFAALCRVVLPKVVETEVETITVPRMKAPLIDNVGIEPEHGLRVDGRDCCTWPDSVTRYSVTFSESGNTVCLSSILDEDEPAYPNGTIEIGDFVKYSLGDINDNS